MPEIFTNRMIPKVMFANCGHENTRRLEDMVRLNFISAGHGNMEGVRPYYFSNQIRNLKINDIIAVYRNRVGYIGIARVISKPMTISEAVLNGENVTPEMFKGNIFDLADDPGYAECLVEIQWLSHVYLGENYGSGACFGMFAKPLVVCSLDNQVLLKKCFEKTFAINFQELLLF